MVDLAVDISAYFYTCSKSPEAALSYFIPQEEKEASTLRRAAQCSLGSLRPASCSLISSEAGGFRF